MQIKTPMKDNDAWQTPAEWFYSSGAKAVPRIPNHARPAGAFATECDLLARHTLYL
jgi:hypothetical protein